MSKQRFKPATKNRFQSDPTTATAKRGPNLDYNTRSNKLKQAQGVYQANRASGPEGITENPFESGYFNEKILGIDMGPVDQSAFDPLNHRDPFNSNIDFEKIRADKQSTITALGNTGIQFIGKTAVGTIGNLIGGFYGLGTIAFGDGNVNALWDNAVYRDLDDYNASVEANNTVFLNRKKGLGLNFELYKDINDAFSFIASAAASEVIMQTVGNAIGGAGILTAPGRWAKWFAGLQKVSDGLGDAKKLEKIALDLGTTVEKMAKVKRNLDLIKAVPIMARKILTTTGYEAGLESRGIKDQMMVEAEENLTKYFKDNPEMSEVEQEAYRKEYMAKAETVSNQAGLATFGMNTAVLSASNMMQFPTLFGSSYLKTKKLYDLERKAMGEVQRATTGKLQRGMSTVGRILKTPFTEYMEETLQYTGGETSKHYYESLLSTDTNGGVLSPLTQQWSSSLWEGLKEAYGTAEGQHEGVIGGIVGAMGLPGMKKVGGRWRPKLNGGVWGSYKDYQKKKKFTDDAISSINDIKISDAMMYKKDQAILSTLDADREDKAIHDSDPVEFEAVQDNKVFRYTQEKMKKGAEFVIDEDVAELKNMDLDTYKKDFQKEDTFTQEEKDKEVNEFAAKVDIYKEAYKKAHKTVNFGGYQYDNKAHNELSDILTHALATEKVYGDRLEALKQTLYKINQEEFSTQEIDAFAVTSGKVKAAQKLIDDYIAGKTTDIQELAREEFRNQIVPIYHYLLDMTTVDLNKAKEALETAKEKEPLGEQLQLQLDNTIKALELKEAYDAINEKKFSASKSSKVRNEQKSIEELTAEVNALIKTQVSTTMESLGKMPEKVTIAELGAYVNIRPELSKAINKEHESEYTLDRIDEVDGENLLTEIAGITERFTVATQIAGAIYKLKSNPGTLYAKLTAGRFFANLDNVKRQALDLHFKKMNGADVPNLASIIEELEFNLPIIKKQYAEIKKNLTAKGKEDGADGIEFIEQTIKMYEAFIDEKKAIEKQENAALGTMTSDEQLLKDLKETLGATEKKDEDESTDKKDELLLEEKENRYTIRESLLSNGSALQSNPGFKTLQELLAEGTIKDKAASTLTLVKDQLDPEKNKELKKSLEKDNMLEAYNIGMEKVIKNPTLLKKPQDKVMVFVKYAPIHLNIYDKIAKKEDGAYDFEIEEADKIVYQQFFFVSSKPYNAEDRKLYEDGLAEIDEQAAIEKKANKARKLTSSYKTRADLKAEINNKKEALKQKYEATNNSILTNEAYRTKLLQNYYLHDTNELKLKVHGVNQGNFESFQKKGKKVNENNVETLGFSAATMDINNFMYTDQNGLYVRLDGTKVKDMTTHPMKEMGTQQSSHVYFGYETKNGRIVPIKMNLTKLQPQDIDLIFRIMKEYLHSDNKSTFRVNHKQRSSKEGVKYEYINEITAKENKILSMRESMKMDDFLSFFLKTKKGKGQPLFLKNTYSLITKNIPLPGEMKVSKTRGSGVQFMLHANDVDNVQMIFPPVDGSKETAEEIDRIWAEQEEDLRKVLESQRHNFNKDFFVQGEDGREMNREAMAVAFETGMINHPFNADTNFDKIFDPDYNKTITLSRADIDDAPGKPSKVRTFTVALQDLRMTITNAKDQAEMSFTQMYYNIEKGIKTSIRIKALKLDDRLDKLPKKEREALVIDSINSVVQARIAQVLKLGIEFPGQIKATDYDSNFEIQKGDTTLDKLLRSLHSFKLRATTNKGYINQIVKRTEHWNALKALLDEFKDPPAGANFPMMSFVPDTDKSIVNNNITSKKQLDTLMRVINVLKQLTDNNFLGYVNINYSETFQKANRIFNNKYVSPGNLPARKLSNKHYKTRLKSVTFEKDEEGRVIPLKWDKETGELIQGAVYFNFGNKPQGAKKEGNQKVLVLAAEHAPTKATNIMTNISLPFISVDGNFELSDELDEMLKDISDNVSEDTAMRTLGLEFFPKDAEAKGGLTAGEFRKGMQEKDPADVTTDEILEGIKESGLLDAVEDDKIKHNLKPSNVKGKGGPSTLFSGIFVVAVKDKDLPADSLAGMKKMLARKGITNLSEYIYAFDVLKEDLGLKKQRKKYVSLGELIFNQKEKDCE